MPFNIIISDIIAVNADAIVSCGNSGLVDSGGVSGHIYRAAGDAAEAERLALRGCAPGDAVVSSGGALPAKYIIHTVGPVWDGGFAGEEFVLRKCYRSVLARAVELGCRSLATPLIASGRYGYPKEEALRVASEEISAFLGSGSEMEVTLVVHERSSIWRDPELDAMIERYHSEREQYYPKLQYLIDDAPVHEERFEADYALAPPCAAMASTSAITPENSLDELLKRKAVSFKNMFRDLLNASGKTDAEVYNSVHVSRQTFNKIWNEENYRPSKKTVIAYAVALHLNYDQTLDLLGTLGFTLSRSETFDIIIEYHIKKGNYNIVLINIALFEYGEGLIGA